MVTDIHGSAKLLMLLAAALYSQPTVVEDCEDAWAEQAIANVTPSADAADKVVGANSAKFIVADGAAAGLLASEAVVLNLTTTRKIGMYVKSSIPLLAGELQLLLDDTALCASPLETLDLPAIPPDAWCYVVMELADPSLLAAVISVGIKQPADLGAFTLHVDQIEAFPFEPLIGAGVNIKDYLGRGKLLLSAGGASAGTNPTLNVKLQESDSQYSGYTDIAGEAFTEVTTNSATEEKGFLIDPRKEWVRAVATLGGVTPAFPAACYLLAPPQEI